MDRNYNEDNPGPGAYYASDRMLSPSAPAHSFGFKTKLYFDGAIPGPGTYNVRSDHNTSPAYTMADRYDGPKGTDIPGPGTYSASIKHTHRAAPAYTMRGPANYNPDQGIPGPGTYDVRGELGGPAFSLGHRLKASRSDNPGPGTYSPNSPSGSPAYSMGQYNYGPSRPLSPGPGTYNLRSATMSGPMFSMGKRFYRLKQRAAERRYSNPLRQRPSPQNRLQQPATNTRGARLQAARLRKTAQGNPGVTQDMRYNVYLRTMQAYGNRH